MVIVSTAEYEEVVKFINKFNGITIDCEKELVRRYPHLQSETLGSIISREGQLRIKGAHSRIVSDIKNIITE